MLSCVSCPTELHKQFWPGTPWLLGRPSQQLLASLLTRILPSCLLPRIAANFFGSAHNPLKWLSGSCCNNSCSDMMLQTAPFAGL